MKHHREAAARPGIEAVLATPAQLRDRIRQLGRPATARDDPKLARVREIVQTHLHLEGALLPILHAVQDALGSIPRDAVAQVADGLNLSRAEVHGVVTYYHHFRSEPAGRHVLEVCRAESCQAMGGEALWSHACEALDLPTDGGTAADGSVTLQPVFCLGLCASSPSAALDGRPHARLDARRLQSLLQRARAGEGVAA